MTSLAIVSPAQWASSSGGAEYQLHLASLFLAEKGVAVHHVSSSGAGGSGFKEYHSYDLQRPSLFKHKAFGATVEAPAIIARLDEIQPDLILQRVASAYTGVCAYYARKRGKKLIWWVSSDKDLDPKPVVGVNSQARHLDRRVFEYGAKSADYIVIQTETQRKIAKVRFPGANFKLIRNFHEVPDIPVSIPKKSKRTLVWVANFKPVKQPQLFMDLARDLSDFNDVHFVMIGRGHQSPWGREIDNRIQHTSNLSWMGEMDSPSVNQVIAEADMLVNTSHYEGFPNTFIQAWMRGVPVASLSVDPDSVIETHGLGFKAGGYAELLKNTRLWLTEPERARIAGDRARAYAEEFHSTSNLGELYGIVRDLTGPEQSIL